jgi:SNF family Na+-dependent transporter
MSHHQLPERWATKLGVILAVAGSAVGLGNFLRFPTMVAQNGGGAFLIPYFCALLLIGLPLMWMEWTFGRYGGLFGRHTLPGIYDVVAKGRRWVKYLGVLGLFVPFIIVVYYTYVESWMLGYSIFSALGHFSRITETAGFGDFLGSYLGAKDGQPMSVPTWAALFLLITLLANFYVIWRGVSRGIEKLTRIAMPLLFIFAVILVIRVLMLPNAFEGLAFLWKPDFSRLGDVKVWLAAAGQIFFTLSLGLGAIIAYSSYLGPKDDVAKSGLSATAMNEGAEVLLGGSLAIPAAVAIFGIVQTTQIAQGSPVALAVITMPAIFTKIPLGELFSTLWFLLLFIAGITSSVSLLQPLVAFLQDELGWTRRQAALTLLLVTAAYLVPVVLWQQFFIDDMDFWSNNILLPLGALIEVLIFAFIFGIHRGWDELKRGAEMHVPVIFKYILLVVTPLYLVVLLGVWAVQEGWAKLTLQGIEAAHHPYIIASRVVMGVIFLAMVLLLRVAWQRQRAGKVPRPTPHPDHADIPCGMS